MRRNRHYKRLFLSGITRRNAKILQLTTSQSRRDTQDPRSLHKDNGAVATMSGRKSQSKGRRAEIELSNYLRERGFTEARAGKPLNYGTEPDVIGIDGLHIECKRHEKLQLNKWYEQAAADAERMQDGKPVVIHRQNRRKWMITLSLEDFIEVMQYAETKTTKVH